MIRNQVQIKLLCDDINNSDFDKLEEKQEWCQLHLEILRTENHTWILVDIFKSGDNNIAWQHFVVVETCLMQLFITEQQNLKR